MISLPLVFDFPHLAITLIASNIEFSVGDCPFDGAIVFMRVGAVRKLAAVDEGANIAEVTDDFCGNHVPQLELPDSRRVDEMPATRQRNQNRRGCRVFAFLVFRTDVTDTELKPRFDRVENRRLANS